MKIKTEFLEKVLLENNYVTPEQIAKIKQNSENKRISFYDSTIQLGVLTKDLIGESIAENYNLKYWDLNSKQPNNELLSELNPDFVKEYRMVLVKKEKNTVMVTGDDPENQKKLLTAIEPEFPGKKVILMYSLPEDITSIINQLESALIEKISELKDDDESFSQDLLKVIFNSAVKLNSSDIHLEPQKDTVFIRLRIDGLLQQVATITKSQYDLLTNHIKIISKLRIDIHNLPQDGAIRYEVESTDRVYDIRVSVVPFAHGEKIVMRVLSSYISGLNLREVGLSESQIDIIKRNITKNLGMILTVGPTGSGKTTTLYALLKEIQSNTINISTIEDPVEYLIRGINQIQVERDSGLDFAKGLRALLRQDPDVILIGEIRDQEPAEIAVNAALTGQLVLSTFHSNDASATLPRLIDMGVEPYLVASTVNLIIGQRLIRKICSHCKISINIDPKKEYGKIIKGINKYFDDGEVDLYVGKGCEKCQQTGYKDRTAIYELLEIDENIEEMIHAESNARDIKKYALKNGFEPFFIDGLRKVKAGITDIEELIRVSPYIDEA